MTTYQFLNGPFGAQFENVKLSQLTDPCFQTDVLSAWTEARGLVAIRGRDLHSLSPEAMVLWARVFGQVDYKKVAAREFCAVEQTPILRIGNTRDNYGKINAMFAEVPVLTDKADNQYNPKTRRPIWHTDSTFLKNPPIGSVFHCKQSPPTGGHTLFADMQGAFSLLDKFTQESLGRYEAVCSLAHHDKKINNFSPDYPTLSMEERKSNPPNRVPLVLTHPVTQARCLYGMNSSTCAVIKTGKSISADTLDKYELEGIEDPSVSILRDLLPAATIPDLVVTWQWKPGDIVVWDNRCTMHAPTGFDYRNHLREMWRLTLVA